MAEIELGRLSDRLTDDEYALFYRKLREHLGDPGFELPPGDHSASGSVADGIDEELVTDFMDRLEASDLSVDHFVLAEFEGKLDCGDFTVGSLYTLVDVLEEMMDDLGIEDTDDEEEEEEEEEDYGSRPIERKRLRALWKTIYDAAAEAIDSKLALTIVR
jgi:hypothetical protein